MLPLEALNKYLSSIFVFRLACAYCRGGRAILSVQVVVIDDLSNSVEESLNRVRELTGCDDDQLIFRKVAA